MSVLVIDVYLDVSGEHRCRVCLRDDGNFQLGIEHLTKAVDGELRYWSNAHPPSGIFGSYDDAITAVQNTLLEPEKLYNLIPIKIDLGIGPWPEPKKIV